MKTANEIVIRAAVRDDCPQIFDVIKERAICHEVPLEFNVEDLEKHGFDAEIPFYHCVVAENLSKKTADGRSKLVGYIIYFFTFTTCGGNGRKMGDYGRKMVVADIHVVGKYRSKNVVSALFDLLSKIGLERGCTSIDGTVAGWNKEAQKYYELKGAVIVDQKKEPCDIVHTYRLSLDTMLALNKKNTRRATVGQKS